MVQNLYTSGEYLKKNPLWHTDESPWKAREILRMLQRNALVPRSICEVGCGAGETLRLLQERMDPTTCFRGYEISPQAHVMAKTRENERLHFLLRDIAQESDVFFDLILVMDVIEHLEDYFSFLRMLHPKSRYKILQIPLDISVRSVLQVLLPNYRETFGHIHYFTKELALQTLKDLQYEVLDYFYTEFTTSQEQNGADESVPLRLKHTLGRTKRELIKLPGRLAFAVNEDIAARIWGRWRLLVLVR
ncbi:MAG: methyltransferase domain-containing protein [Ktedonobacteraceae bacterium]|nr:methyltransferase domain-containing protein [Ktedonobacteraceae bacterium]